MQYLYRISSSYDGFTPQRIGERLIQQMYITYNWREYFDNLERGDIVFTYFTGPRVRKGIYLISKIVKINKDKKVTGRVLRYDQDKSLVNDVDLRAYGHQIFTRPRGTVFVIPPSLRIIFEDLNEILGISEVEIHPNINCPECVGKSRLVCEKCPIMSPNFLIKWEDEVRLQLRKIVEITSPFWIIPRQSHWIKKSISEHPLSQMFYSFKAGYEKYSMLFGLGILQAISYHQGFDVTKFDYILGIPLSPDKKKMEFDRVAELCKIISKGLHVDYRRSCLTLSSAISRKAYKRMDMEHKFRKDYYSFLQISKLDLNNKVVLLIDDVVTDGATLQVAAKKIRDMYPDCQIYAATAGTMAKKKNMTARVIRKYKK